MHPVPTSPKPSAAPAASSAEAEGQAPTHADPRLTPNGPRGMLFKDMDLRELGRRRAL